MKKLIYIILMLCLCVNNSSAQVKQEGNNFTQVSVNKSSKETKTDYTYTDNKGIKYDVYLGSTGKTYIKKISKKTGKEYKVYLPEIGKIINPKAYKDK